MGIITQIDIITKEFWAITIALFVGTLVALIFAAKFMDYLTIKAEKKWIQSFNKLYTTTPLTWLIAYFGSF